ncbi:hypothetical protein, partial [Ruminococcus sp.]|uniref:hypothetical protein n=1 Tax=Ruminococcus sp. TaxID=41978 RepID=UPI001B5D9F22
VPCRIDSCCNCHNLRHQQDIPAIPCICHRVTNQYLHCIAEADEAAANVLQEMLITKKDSSEPTEAIQKIQKKDNKKEAF